MVKGGTVQTKVHLKGEEDDFIVFIEDLDTYKQWVTDKSVPMAHFISAFKVFVTHKQGTQGQLDDASKSTMENQFHTSNVEQVIEEILQKGNVLESQFPERQGSKNDSQMGSIINGQNSR